MAYSVQLLWANNAQTTLANSISNTSTTANLASGAGSLFPNPGSGQGFVGTFKDQATGLLTEIVLVTGRTGDTITMSRGQEGTTALNWSANDLFANLWTKGTAETLIQLYQLQEQSTNYAVDTGVVNAYVIGLTPAISVAPTPGTPIRFKVGAGNTNTGASTINAGWGAVPIVRIDGSALIGGELPATQIVEGNWNGTSVQLMRLAQATNAAITAGTDTASAVTPAQLAATSFAPTGSITASAALAAPSGWLLCYGQEISRTTFATLFAAITKSAAVTISIATPGVVTWASHGLQTGDIISFETTGALPTGLSSATNYYAIKVNANTFQIASSAANALAGTAIPTSGSQSGVQTCRQNPFGCGDGSSTFNLPDGRDVALVGNTWMGGTARNLLGGNSSVGGFATAAMGNMAGAKNHVQTTPEIGAHNHAGQGGGSSGAGSGGGSGFNFIPPGDTTGTITGSSTPFNITQPTLLVNVFIKT
jgi:hypothetical protein